jgi:RNA polymerase sigma-B factor
VSPVSLAAVVDAAPQADSFLEPTVALRRTHRARRRKTVLVERMPTDELLAQLGPQADTEVQAEVVRRFVGLATSCAKAFWSSGEPLDELVQVARIGLYGAVRRFDPNRGFSFRSFAVPTINGELKRHLRDHTWSVKVSRSGKDASIAVRQAADALRPSLSAEASLFDIATHLGWTTRRVAEAVAVGAVRLGNSFDERLLDRCSPEELEESVVAHETLRALVAVLDGRDRLIIYLRFVQDLSQEEIAQHIGVTQVQVSRLLTSIMRRLRERLAAAQEPPDTDCETCAMEAMGYGVRSAS